MPQEISFNSLNRQASITELIEELSQKTEFTTSSHLLDKHLGYQKILLKCLPSTFQHQIFFAGIEQGIWQLWVSNPTTRFQLNFVLPEIADRMQTYLPRRPHFYIRVYPNLWREVKPYRRPIQVPTAREYNATEAKCAIERYLKTH